MTLVVGSATIPIARGKRAVLCIYVVIENHVNHEDDKAKRVQYFKGRIDRRRHEPNLAGPAEQQQDREENNQ